MNNANVPKQKEEAYNTAPGIRYRCRYRTIGRSARGTRSVGLIDIKRRNAKLLRCAMHEICMQRFGGKNIGSHRSDVTESIGSHRRFRPPPDVAYVKSAPIIKAGENKYVPEQISCYIVDCCPHCHVMCGRKHRPRARRPGSNSCQHTHHVLFLSPTMHQEQMMVLIGRSNCPKGIESPSCFRKAHRNTPWAQRGMISQHQAWPSRIAYATRPLGVRCRPRESIPTQCPGRHVAWNFILPGGTQPARRRGARRRSKRGTAAITEGNDITARECAASAK